MARKKKKTVSTEIKSDTLSVSEEKATIFNDKSPSGLFGKNKSHENIKHKKQDKTVAMANTTTGIPRMPFWAFFPIMLMVGFVPLIVRLKILEVSPEAAPYWPDRDRLGRVIVYDFFSYYKSLWIIGLTLVMLLMFFFLFKKEYVKRGKVAIVFYIAAAVFLIFSLISTLMSQYPETSWWGAPDRREGMIINACYIFMMLYSMYIFNDIKDFKYFLYPLIFLTVCATIIGGFQFFKYDLMTTRFGQNLVLGEEYAYLRGTLHIKMHPGQIYATFFNPNYVGSFGALVVPLFAGLALFGENWKQRAGYGVLALCGIFLAIGSSSVGGMFGIAMGILSLGGWIVLELIRNRRWTAIGIGVSIVVLSVTIGGFLTHRYEVTMVKKAMGALSTMLGRSNLNEDSFVAIENMELEGHSGFIKTKEGTLRIKLSDEGSLKFYDREGKEVVFDFQGDQWIFMPTEILGKGFCIKEQIFSEGASVVVLGRNGWPFARILADSHGELNFLGGDGRIMTYVNAPSVGWRGRETTASGRGYIWSRLNALILKSPFFGYGADSVLLVFPQNDFGKINHMIDCYTIVDKAHNLFVMIALNQGLAALMAFLILIGCYARLIWRNAREKINKKFFAEYPIWSGIAGFLVSGIANDSVVSVSPLFWILLGIGISLGMRDAA